MIVADALRLGTDMLAAADKQVARTDARILLEAVLDIDRAHLLAYPERVLTAEQLDRYQAWLQRRAQYEPVAYILGHEAFAGLDFLVDKRVLIPRPETELLVELALEHISARLDAAQVPVVADIGTGSGAIPVSIVVAEPRLPFIYACDISVDALDVARSNCERHHVLDRVRLLQGDLLEPLPQPVDILLANLPYVGTSERSSMTPDVLDYEPEKALFSGPQGLDLIFRLCRSIHTASALKPGGVLLLEIGYQQASAIVNLLHALWPAARLSCKKDYAGWDRLVEMVLLQENSTTEE